MPFISKPQNLITTKIHEFTVRYFWLRQAHVVMLCYNSPPQKV